MQAAQAALGDLPDIRAINLLSPAWIRRSAGGLQRDGIRIDLLIHSAGIIASPLFRDSERHEGQFATNHLGHFRLTEALWPLLNPGARIVVLTSRGHQIPGFDLKDLDFTRRAYDKWKAYG